MKRTIAAAIALLAMLAALVVVAPASAATTQLSGMQTYNDNRTPADPSDDYFDMTGGLVGKWYTTSFDPGPSGGWPVRGTEYFIGCIDTDGDRTCAREGESELEFEFEYTGAASGNARCHHTIVGARGAFEGASGVLTFKDRPTAAGLVTTYKGHITL